MEAQVSFEQVISLAQRLTVTEKLRLIERLSSDLKATLPESPPIRRRGLRGFLKGSHITDVDIDEVRQEMWSNFGREDI